MINKSDAEVKLKVTTDSNASEKGMKNLNEEAKKTPSHLDKIKSVGATVFKGLAVGIGAASTALGALVMKSVKSYADYEQLEGGVKTLFEEIKGGSKEAYEEVMKNAKGAYKTAGMSANEYMDTVTSFSASLISSLGNDTKKAAKTSDMAITDMADNANKMGTSIEMIQSAYQGFAKQNYTMLDNLKLGYGGTETEMKRLLADAQKITGVKYDINNLNDVFNAIHVIQGELGITGTTAKEAESTISGSVSMVKAAFDNFLNGSGSPKELANTIAIAFKNIGNAIIKLAPDVINGFVELLNILIPQLPQVMEKILPALIGGAANLVSLLIKELPNILSAIVKVMPSILSSLIKSTNLYFPGLIEKVKKALAILIPLISAFKTYQVVMKGLAIINSIKKATEGMTLAQYALNAAMSLNPIGIIIALIAALVAGFIYLWNTSDDFRTFWIGLWEGLVNIVTVAWEWLKGIFDTVINFFKNNWQALLLLLVNPFAGAFKLLYNNCTGFRNFVNSFVNTIVNWFKSIPGKLKSMATGIVNVFKSITSQMFNVGKNIVQGLWNGISGLKNWVINKVKSLGKSILNGIKGILGIHSPSTEFALIGKFSILGLEEGFEDNEKELHKTIEDTIGLDFLKNGSVNVSNMYGNLTPNISNNQPIYVNVEADMDVDKFGRAFVNDIKVFSGGTKNSFNYGGGK